jgi:hypothetical protein
MRIGLGNVLTTEQHLRTGWEIIREAANIVIAESATPAPNLGTSQNKE